MKLAIAVLIFAAFAFGQTLPTLPPVNTLTVSGVTCTITVIDQQMSVSGECLAADGTILYRATVTPSTKGNLVGAGPIVCLHWTDGAATPTVRLQCSTDDDTTAPKLALDGKLAPVSKKRSWWIFWR